jgi:hypothetical protein
MDIIWLARNKLIHKCLVPNPIFCLKSISSMIRAHLKALLDSSSVPEAWDPPPQGLLKTNFDVVICSMFNVTAVVLSDHIGLIQATCTKKLPLWMPQQGKPMLPSWQLVSLQILDVRLFSFEGILSSASFSSIKIISSWIGCVPQW